jgi:ABC-type phosphate/phosphonate transport system substrate-binding protein
MMHTQSSSKPRLKNDTLGNDALTGLYNAFKDMSDVDFEQYCVDTIQAGGGHQPTKDKLVAAVRDAKTRMKKLEKAQNFILAGMGLGV